MTTPCKSNDDERVSSRWFITQEDTLKTSPNGFWEGLHVWLRRPHVINRRLCAVNTITEFSIESTEFDDVVQALSDVRGSFPLLTSDEEKLKNCFVEVLRNSCRDNGHESVVIEIRELLPKRCGSCEKAVEIVIKDVTSCVVAFLSWLGHSEVNEIDNSSNFLSPRHCYAFRYSEMDNSLQLLIWRNDLEENDGITSSDVKWLQNKVFPKVNQWIKETDSKCVDRKKVIPSLSLISTIDYVTTYQHLKEKYGLELVKIWPERTDPSKFVYEDIAIASYLMVLWNEERKENCLVSKQSFVDLGCGNGLLTHILCSEGYPGFGIDIKKRNIWDLYGEQTKLIVDSITPSSESLFPKQDWIIGNHSDELTPWIPVISARSSLESRFFVLPCCAHNFDSKFQRRNSSMSQYEDYLEFVREVGETCGFHVEIDKLRIPSTKRTCLIGKRRTYKMNEWSDIDERITNFIKSQSCRTAIPITMDPSSNSWATNFQVRDSVQLVRNCTTIEHTIKLHIVNVVFEALLNGSVDFVDTVTENGVKSWRKGGEMGLSELAAKLDASILRKLKSECGGLQTLLRNHYYIFKVIQGKVSLRNYSEDAPRPRRQKLRPQALTVRTKLCWFRFNHPDGCPIVAEKCLFAHDDRDLNTVVKRAT